MAAAGVRAGQRWPAGRAPLVLAGSAVCAVVLMLGYVSKLPCVGPGFNALGRSIPDWRLRINRDLCYSSIQEMWLGRDVNLHVFPYVHGAVGPGNKLIGGAVEYPVLTGLVMWLGAIGAHNDGQFLWHSALILAPFGLLTGALLFRMAGRRAWWFALAPALALYAFLSWDLLAVSCVVAGLAAVVLGTGRWGRRRSAVLAAVAFGLGGAAKFYPLMFAAPVIAWLLRPEPGGDAAGARAGPDRAGAALVAVAAAGTFAVVNAPFAVAGFRGWWASFQFQWARPIDDTTNSIWFWGAKMFVHPDDPAVQRVLAQLSLATTIASMGAVLAAGFLLARWRRTGYPALPVCGALLCAYLLCNKVHSPQYALWLLPFFVLVQIPAGLIAAYFVADLTMLVGFLHWQYLLMIHEPPGVVAGWPIVAVLVGVWGRAALLVGLIVVFLRAEAGTSPEPGVAADPAPGGRPSAEPAAS